MLLRLVPDEVLPATGRQLGFWGGDPAAADRAERVLARVQGMLGHPTVVTAVPQGGRTPGERVRWVPWGDPREPARPLDAVAAPGANAREVPPWPGAIPAPAPARVFDPPPPAELLDAAGEVVTVSGRGDPSAPPARPAVRGAAGPRGRDHRVGGPWAHDARWWDRRAQAPCLLAGVGGRARRRARRLSRRGDRGGRRARGDLRLSQRTSAISYVSV